MKHDTMRYRENMRAMGFKQLTVHVPHDVLDDFRLWLERARAERMLTIAQTHSVIQESRVALATKNMTAVPAMDVIRQLVDRVLPTDRELALKKMELYERHCTDTNAATYAAGKAEDNDESVKWQSLAVAHNAMANALYSELKAMAQVK